MKVRVQVDGETYEVEIGDLSSRPIQAMVAGELFTVWPEEVAGVATSTTATTPAATGEVTPSRVSSPPLFDGAEETVMAPLPGDIVVVAVRAGERVEEGQLLCTLESMKMNNPVRSPRAGVVDEVFVAVGDHVNYGQPLMRLR